MGALVAPALYLPERVVGRQGAEHAYESDNTYVVLSLEYLVLPPQLGVLGAYGFSISRYACGRLLYLQACVRSVSVFVRTASHSRYVVTFSSSI